MKLTLAIDNDRLNYSYSNSDLEKHNGSKKLSIADSIFFHDVLKHLITEIVLKEEIKLEEK